MSAPSFGLTGATGVVTKISGGSINLVQANTAATPVDYNETGTMVYSGGTLNVGTAATATNFVFRVQGQTPNVVVDNSTNNKTLNLSGQLNVWGNLTINAGHDGQRQPGNVADAAPDRADDHEQRRDHHEHDELGHGQLRRQPPGARRGVHADLHGQRNPRHPERPAWGRSASRTRRRHDRPGRFGTQREQGQRLLRRDQQLRQDLGRRR